MNTPKAIFFDLDGTVLSTGKLPDSAKEAINYAKKKGVLLFTATGRHRKEFENMPWFPDIPFDGFVTMNGAYSFITNKTIYKKPINKEAISWVVEYLASNPMYCMFCEAKDIYANKEDEIINAGQIAYGLRVPPIRDPKTALNGDVFQIVTFGKDIGDFLHQLPSCTITSWNENCYDIVPEGINKWVGILPMLDHFGLKPEEVAAIGDGENDIEMLENAGYSIAMGNGINKVKQAANYVTTHIDDDGILNAIKHLLG
ncbi:MAG: Cof-type HAD-IIB family hydrolase [Defluviitaleaceae bacterium]|nr:Cof-type HAD-IIB family hydrolase [Defluviitaleaceae bacterium]